MSIQLVITACCWSSSLIPVPTGVSLVNQFWTPPESNLGCWRTKGKDPHGCRARKHAVRAGVLAEHHVGEGPAPGGRRQTPKISPHTSHFSFFVGTPSNYQHPKARPGQQELDAVLLGTKRASNAFHPFAKANQTNNGKQQYALGRKRRSGENKRHQHPKGPHISLTSPKLAPSREWPLPSILRLNPSLWCYLASLCRLPAAVND